MTRTTRPLLYLLVALFAVVLTGCGNIDKLVERGNYDEAVRLAQRRLTGKQKKNPKYVRALEEAFNRVTAADMERARRQANGGTAHWAEIEGIYRRVQRRQDALRPLLPLVDKNGYEARFRFARVEGLIAEAGEKAAAQYYAEATAYLPAARAGSKADGRRAYSAFQKVLDYRGNYRDARTLLGEARELGRVYVAVEFENRTGGYLPPGLESALLRPDGRNLDDRWRTYDFQPVRGRTYDYRARITIDDIQASPERVNQRAYVDEKEITDGNEYVLDENGNVAKDTLGNDITRPRRVIVRAEVLEVLQQKSVAVAGSLELYDLRARRVVDAERLTAEAVFEHYASTFNGDRRALSQQSRRRIGNRPVDFPPTEALILDAADRLKPRLQDHLARSSRVI